MTVSADNPKKTRVAKPTRVFTPARIVALALIVVLALSLAYLRFAPDAGSVSVPAGAKAGDLILKPGSYATENGSYKADVGTLVVPENRADPGSRLIALPVIRIRARSDHPAEPIFRLEGGPGVTNMEFAKASRFADDHDVVLVGYRGVDGSVRLDAPEVESALKHSADLLSEKSFGAVAEAYRSAAKRLQAEGVDLAGYGLAQQVDDFEAARVALGYGRIDLLSESAGTRTAMIYSWRYPESIHRSVMIGVNPPGNFLWDPKTTDEQIARYAALYAKDDASRDGTTGDLAASMRYTATHMPDRWLFLPIKQGNVRVISFFGLMESTPEAAPASAPMVLDSWLSAAKGDASGFWFASLAADFLVPKMFVWGQYAAAGEARRPSGARLLLLPRAGARFEPRRRRNGVRLGRWRADRCLAGRTGRGRVQPCADVERGDAPHRRGSRLLDAAADRDEGAPPVPAERPPGRAAGVRPLDVLLDAAAGSRHPAGQHLPRQRQGRRLALQAAKRRLHAHARPRRHREDRPRRDARVRGADRALASVDGSPGAQARAPTDARRARRCGRCTRSCSASADGSSAP